MASSAVVACITAPDRYRQIGELFEAVLDRSPAERAGYLSKICVGDEELRSQVDDLLRHHLETGKFLAPFGEEALPAEPAPNSIGLYSIRRQLGEGGMGTVYLAEQSEPFRREVALKVIRPGMGSMPTAGWDSIRKRKSRSGACWICDAARWARMTG